MTYPSFESIWMYKICTCTCLFTCHKRFYTWLFSHCLYRKCNYLGAFEWMSSKSP